MPTLNRKLKTVSNKHEPAQRPWPANEAPYRTVFETIPSAIFTVDLNRRITAWNNAAEQIIGLRAEKVIGSECQKTFDCHAASGQCPLFDTGVAKPVMGWECRLTLPGRQLILLKNMDVLRDAGGDIIGGLETFIDISAQKQTEAELTAARDQAESADRAKGALLAGMSHEIRTPMNGLIGLLDLTLDGLRAHGGKHVRHMQMARDAATRLMVLLNEILDYSKLDAGKLKLNYKRFGVRRFLRQVLAAYGVLCLQKGLNLVSQVDADVPEEVIGDAGRLGQILTNLLANAVKFTPHGQIAVRISRAASRKSPADKPITRSQWLRFAVTDTGIGIPADQHDAIFDAFNQVEDPAGNRSEGVGLGLNICKQLIDRMGGRLEVHSRLGVGSRFAFWLPFVASRSLDCGNPPSEAHPLRPATPCRATAPLHRLPQPVAAPATDRTSGDRQPLPDPSLRCLSDETAEDMFAAGTGLPPAVLDALALLLRRGALDTLEKEVLKWQQAAARAGKQKLADTLFRVVLACRREQAEEVAQRLEAVRAVAGIATKEKDDHTTSTSSKLKGDRHEPFLTGGR